jgi:hypothetical protein
VWLWLCAFDTPELGGCFVVRFVPQRPDAPLDSSYIIVCYRKNSKYRALAVIGGKKILSETQLEGTLFAKMKRSAKGSRLSYDQRRNISAEYVGNNSIKYLIMIPSRDDFHIGILPYREGPFKSLKILLFQNFRRLDSIAEHIPLFWPVWFGFVTYSL